VIKLAEVCNEHIMTSFGPESLYKKQLTDILTEIGLS